MRKAASKHYLLIAKAVKSIVLPAFYQLLLSIKLQVPLFNYFAELKNLFRVQ